MTFPLTPSQTIGPFSHEAWQWATRASEDARPAGAALTLEGTVYDGAGAPVDDAMIEFSVPAGAPEADNLLPGFRRVPSDAQGRFQVLLPRPQPGQPAALVTIFARGLLVHAFTAVFLDGGEELLEQVPAARRATLLASPAGPAAWRWDIRLQGEHETVFFDYA